MSDQDIKRIKNKTVIDSKTGCWIFVGATARGYGRIWINGKLEMVHRLAYEFFVGHIPEGKILDHVKAKGCTSRACWNIEHLEPVTNHENILRGMRNQNTGKTRCKHGHEFNSNNTIIRSNGNRDCRQCHKRWKAEFLMHRKCGASLNRPKEPKHRRPYQRSD